MKNTQFYFLTLFLETYQVLLEKLEKDLARIQGKLANAAFVEKAPAEVVAKEKEKMQAQQQALDTLQEQARHVGQL